MANYVSKDGLLYFWTLLKSKFVSVDVGVTHTKNTKVGSTTKGVYVDTDGSVKEMTYSLGQNVTSSSKLTDHITSVSSTVSGSGDVITDVTADANGVLTLTKGNQTWTNLSGKPSSFTPASHNQASSTITAMTSYSKPSSTSAIATTDSLNTAIGKLEKALDGKQASGNYLTSHQDISGKVNKSGDDMTGALSIQTPVIATGDNKNALRIASTYFSDENNGNAAVEGGSIGFGNLNRDNLWSKHAEIRYGASYGENSSVYTLAMSMGSSYIRLRSVDGTKYIELSQNPVGTSNDTSIATTKWVKDLGYKTTDTKNTAGSTSSTSKLFIVGATEQSANPQTYSNTKCYVGTDNCLYSNNTKVLTAHQSLANYYNKTEIDSKLTSAMRYKGSVATVSALPTTDNAVGDMWNVTDTGANYVWDGSAWDETGMVIDLSPYAKTSDLVAVTNTEIDTIVAS